MTNAETELTAIVRTRLEGLGCHCVKLSDRFTRGVPDLLVVSDRIVMLELKVFVATASVHTYQQLGMSGAQDHHVRQMCRRSLRAAACVTGKPDGGALALWTPVSPESELVPNYRLAASDEYRDGVQVVNWILGAMS